MNKETAASCYRDRLHWTRKLVRLQQFGREAAVWLAAAFAVTGALSPYAAAQGSSAVTLDAPGAVATFGRDINNNGDIVGWFIGNGRHGFLLRSGDYSQYTQIDAPSAWDASGTTALGINDAGTIVGSYLHLDGDGYVHQHAYARNANGGFTTIADVPGATDTIARAINDAGVVVGFYFDQAGNEHGFVNVNNNVTSVDVQGALGTATYGVNNNGDVVGDYADSVGNVHGYVRSPAALFSTFDVPGATVQPAGTNAFAINDAGQVGGFDARSKSAALDYSKPPADLHAYVMTGGKFVAVNMPDATNTCIFGLNNSDQAVGQYSTPDGTTHGFYIQVVAAH